MIEVKRLFRPHRGQLEDSMSEAVEIQTKSALIDKIKSDLSSFECGLDISQETVKIKPYGFDNRIGWDTHIVSLDGYGVIGFTNDPLDGSATQE